MDSKQIFLGFSHKEFRDNNDALTTEMIESLISEVKKLISRCGKLNIVIYDNNSAGKEVASIFKHRQFVKRISFCAKDEICIGEDIGLFVICTPDSLYQISNNVKVSSKCYVMVLFSHPSTTYFSIGKSNKHYPPVIIASSINSGTTLLGPILEHVLDNHDYYHKRMLPINRIKPHQAFFKEMTSREITFEHYKVQELASVLEDHLYRIIFLCRDIRDIFISHYLYMCRYIGPKISPQMMAFRKHINEMGWTDIEAINTLILKENYKYEENGNIYHFPSLGSLYRLIDPWIEHIEKGNCLLVRFEDLINDMKRELCGIMEFIGLPVNHEDIERASLDRDAFRRDGRKRGVEEQGSFFRKGSSGQWKNYFDKGTIKYCKEIIGDLLIKLGYETDFSW
jgi:hypothetical protein